MFLILMVVVMTIGKYNSIKSRICAANMSTRSLKRVCRECDRWQALTNNPHSAQAIGDSSAVFVDREFCRVLSADSPERDYVRREGLDKSVIHWGQRKLLMSEIEFLTLLSRDQLRNAEVVYAGAAPGTHVEFLCGLFPTVHFTLVDPAPFTVRESDSIDIIRGMFTDELAERLRRRFRDRVVVFISDIRTSDPDVDTSSESELKISSDMWAQQRWHVLMRPFRSMFKFRLPWDDGVSRYLAGDIYLPVWGPQTTTECRLVTGVNSIAKTVYDHRKHESQMFYFNCVTRPSLYDHGVCAEGLDHCYDCKAEVEILKRYLQLTPLHFPGENMNEKIANLSMDISRSISSRRTLADPNPDKESRRRIIKRRQHVGGRPAYL